MDEDFGTLRLELDKNGIKYKNYAGFDDVKELMKKKSGLHMMVIHNEGVEDKDIPVDLIETNNLKIYFYPKQARK